MLIITPNPAIDHTVRLSEVRLGEVLRTYEGISVAGGKGGNVSRAAKCLGAKSTVLALVPDIGAAHLKALYAAEGFALRSVPVQGRVRTCTALLEDDGRVTLLNEPGAAVTAADWQRLMTEMTTYLSDGPLPGPIVCSGSLPPGAPADGYAQIVVRGHAAGREVLVDASREPLTLALAAGADFLCPNLAEAEAVLATLNENGGPGAISPRSTRLELVDDAGDDVPQRAQSAAAALVVRGAKWAVVTAGSSGAAVAGPDVSLWLLAPRVTVRNPIGAGDSFLAGIVTARLVGKEWPDAIRRGLASGSASVEQDAAGVVDPARVNELELAIRAVG